MIIGDLKSLCSLWTHLASATRYQRFVSKKDLAVFDERSANEGITFLTCTLPTLGKALDEYFSTQKFTCPLGFSERDGLPLFLGKAFKQALEGDSPAVDCIRQLTYAFYKLEVPYESEKTKSVLENFRETDKELARFSDFTNPSETIMRARAIIRRILCNTDPLLIRPRHSNGATACRTKNRDKYYRLRFFPKLDDVYSYTDYFFYSPTHLCDELDALQNAEVGNPQARVCLVPKDSRGPRIISCEPSELMFIQQGIMRLLYQVLETHPLTAGFVNFTDQSVNRDLARTSSISGELATLDMKDASDRVSLELVRFLFPENWFRALDACRSTSTLLPSGEIVNFNKFAPMGSSCCFPVEAMVFWAIAQAATHGSNVYVYGDDIICSTVEVERVVDAYTSVGLLVNTSKCFSQGVFRESCGGDYHNGYDVTPVRIKKFLGQSHSEWIASIELANSLICKFGYESWISSFFEDIYGPIPRTELPIPGTLRTELKASNDVFYRRRWNTFLQRYEYKIRRLVSNPAPSTKCDWAELLRFELESDRSHGPLNLDSFFALKKSNKLNPGEYVDTHSTRVKWEWAWLG